MTRYKILQVQFLGKKSRQEAMCKRNKQKYYNSTGDVQLVWIVTIISILNQNRKEKSTESRKNVQLTATSHSTRMLY